MRLELDSLNQSSTPPRSSWLLSGWALTAELLAFGAMWHIRARRESASSTRAVFAPKSPVARTSALEPGDAKITDQQKQVLRDILLRDAPRESRHMGRTHWRILRDDDIQQHEACRRVIQTVVKDFTRQTLYVTEIQHLLKGATTKAQWNTLWRQIEGEMAQAVREGQIAQNIGPKRRLRDAVLIPVKSGQRSIRFHAWRSGEPSSRRSQVHHNSRVVKGPSAVKLATRAPFQRFKRQMPFVIARKDTALTLTLRCNPSP